MKQRSKRQSSISFLLAALLVIVAVLAPSARSAYAATALSLSRNIAPPGGRVDVSGHGFHANDTVFVVARFSVAGNAQELQAFAVVSGNGDFSAAFAVPQNAAAGISQISAIDSHNDIASTQLTVLPQAYVPANGTGNTTYVPAGELFAVRGTGFQPGERVDVSASFPLYSGNAVVAHGAASANAGGAFSQLVLRVPAGAKAQATTLTARGATSGRIGRSRIFAIYRSTITAAPLAIRPGGSTTVSGLNFVPNSQVSLSVTIARNGSTSITSNKTATVAANGSFSTPISLPNDVTLGTYTIFARDSANGAHPSAKVDVTVHQIISALPGSVLPGQTVVISGSGYSYFSSVNVHAMVPLVTGGTRGIGGTVSSNGQGAFTARLFVPGAAASSSVTVTAGGAHGQASTHFQVTRPAPPKPRPTSTPLPAPTATVTPLPAPSATAFPVSTGHHNPFRGGHFRFKSVSLWYHTVTVGTFDHLVVQGAPTTQFGIWVHVYLPNGQRQDFYENTDDHGYWERQFKVPRNAIAKGNNQAVVTIRLWSGGKHRDTYVNFNLVP